VIPALIRVPADALVLLVGPSGSGKSTFARRHFAQDEVVSSDAFRAAVSGNEADQSATQEAFRLLHDKVRERLDRGLLTVVDATNLLHWARQPLLQLAVRHGRLAVAIVLSVDLEQSLVWNKARPGRRVPASVVRRQHRLLRHSLAHLADEGLSVHVLSGAVGVSEAAVIRDPPG
jgi:protein phosphatase